MCHKNTIFDEEKVVDKNHLRHVNTRSRTRGTLGTHWGSCPQNYFHMYSTTYWGSNLGVVHMSQKYNPHANSPPQSNRANSLLLTYQRQSSQLSHRGMSSGGEGWLYLGLSEGCLRWGVAVWTTQKRRSSFSIYRHVKLYILCEAS